jgi:membrane-bound ClpP family serine protease
MWTGWINLILGVWTLISGLVSGLQGSANYIIVGIILAILSFVTAAKKWQGIICGILGLWLIFSGIVAGLQGGANLIIVGILIIILGFLLGVAKSKEV